MKIDSTPARNRITLRATMLASLLTALCLMPLASPASAEDLTSRMTRFAHSESNAAPAAPTIMSPREIYDHVIHSTVWLWVEKEDGWYTSSGFVVDAELGFIFTNHHSIEGALSIRLLFPQFENGVVINDSAPYYDAMDNGEFVPAYVYDSDRTRDIALVQAQAAMPATTKALEIADASASPADRVHTIGGSATGTDGAFIYCNGSVRSIAMGPLANGYLARKLETDMEINQGNSGGPIVNDQGIVVGICEGYMDGANSVAMGVDVMEVRNYVSELLPIIADLDAPNLRLFALRHLNEDRPEVAVMLLDRSLELEPNSIAALVDRGWCHFKSGNSDDAVADLNRALREEPNHVDALIYRAQVHRSMNALNRSLEDINRAVSLDTQNAEAHFQRGVTHLKNQQNREALADLDRAIELDDSQARFFVRRAKLYVTLNQIDPAIDDISRSLELDSTNDYSYYLIGYLLTQQGEHVAAVDYFLEAVMLRMEYVPYLLSLGDAACSAENFELAVSAYDQALMTEPDNSHALQGKQNAMSQLNG